MAGVRQIVTGPEFTPLPNFLWDAAQQRSGTTDPHWQQGVTWESRCGGVSTVYDECIAVTGTGGAPAAQGSMASTAVQTVRGATPFTVFAEFDCSPVGQELILDKAEEALGRSEAYQVSRSFWTGAAGSAGGTGQTTVWPHLAAATALDDPQGIRLQSAASLLVTGGDDAAAVMGALEANLSSCYGGQGVIHIPLSVFSTFKADKLVCRENPGDPWTSPAGHLVVPGNGYTGSSPAGVAPLDGTAWVYATGAVFAYRSDVFVRQFPDTFDRSENTVKMIASRTYLFGFDCCHYAALVNIGVPTT